MNKTISIWKRLGAFLLAVSLVVGICPVRVAAAEDTLYPLEASLTRTYDQVTDKHTYTVQVLSNILNEADVKYYWNYDTSDDFDGEGNRKPDSETYIDNIVGGSGDDQQKTFVSDRVRSIGVIVLVDGITLKVVLPNDSTVFSSEPNPVWGAKTTSWEDDKQIEFGVPFEIGTVEPDANSGVYGGMLNTEDTVAEFCTSVGGKYVIAPDAALAGKTRTIVTRKILAGTTGDVHRADETLTAKLVYPKYNAQFTVDGNVYSAGDSLFVSAEKEVTVFVSNACGVEDKAYLPEVSGSNGWADAEGGWTTTVQTSSNVTVGNETLNVTLDDAPVQISNASAYIDNNGDTVVSFKCEVGASGVAAVALNGTPVTFENGSSVKAKLSGAAETVDILVTNGAGETGSYEDVAVTNKLTIESSLESDVVTVNGYISKESTVTVTINGIDGTVSTLAAVTMDGTDVTGAFTNNVGVFNLSEAAGKTFKVTDNLGRSASCSVVDYIVDLDAPVIQISQIEGYFQAEQKLPVFITDGSGAGLAAGIKVTYQTDTNSYEMPINYNEGDKTAETIITVNPGETLLGIKVTGVKDVLGHAAADASSDKMVVVDNVAPTVNAEFSPNVLGFKEFNGKIFAILTPVTDDKDESAPEAITMTVTVSDPHMDLGSETAWTAGGSDTYTKTFTAEVSKHQTGVLTFVIPADDLANNHYDSVTLSVVSAEGDASPSFTASYNAEKKAYVGSLNIDRRYPSSDTEAAPPKVEMVAQTEGIDVSKGDETIKLYNGSVTFDVVVTDTSAAGADSGLDTIDFAVSGADFLTSTYTGGEDGKYTVTVTAGTGETKDAILSTIVKDKTGNTYTYSHAFAVDTKAPEVVVTQDPAAPVQTLGGVEYYDKDVTYSITVTDLFPSTAQIDLDGTTIYLDNGVTKPITIGGNMNKMVITAKDRASNGAATVVRGPSVVDKVDPVIQVERKYVDGSEIPAGTAICSKEVVYNITVTDDNMADLAENLTISFTVEGKDAKPTTVSLPTAEGGITKKGNSYLYSFTVKNDQRLVDWTVEAKDNANRTSSAYMDPADIPLVDTDAPIVTVNKLSGPQGTSATHEYYNAPVTYTITVEDDTIDAASGSVKLVGTFVEGKQTEITLEPKEGKLYGEFQLVDTEELKDIQITVVDGGGLNPEVIGGNAGTFASKNGVFSWSGTKHPVVDMTMPTAELTFESATEGVTLKNYYLRDGINYLKLEGQNDDKVTSVEIKAILTVTDRNLAEVMMENNSNADTNEGWSFTGEVNEEGATAVLTQIFKVEKNNTRQAQVSLSIFDFATNPLVVDAATIPAINTTSPKYNIPETPNGDLIFDLVLDFRPPTSGEDTDAPAISVTPDAPYTASNGVALYGDAFDYDLVIRDNDGLKLGEEYSSGLEEVVYTITDGAGLITPVNQTTAFGDNDGRQQSYTIPVEMGVGETNSAVLSISASDKAGNAITYDKLFGVDNLAPRVAVTFDNNDVKNEKYFNAPRTATIAVEDINFNADTTVITTQATPDPWNGGVITVPYTAEGEYTLNITSTDRASNHTADTAVIYEGNAAPQEFIIDMTAPVVKVTKSTTGKMETKNGMDYYSHPVDYVFQISDKYIDLGTMTISYTKTVLGDRENPVTETVTLGAEHLVDGIYQYGFTLESGDYLTDMSITVVDNAGNSFELDPASNVGFDSNGAYTGNDVLVDGEAPTVKVTTAYAEGDYTQSVENNAFFKGEVTYTVEISDFFLNPDTTSLTYTVNGEEVVVDLNAVDVVVKDNQYETKTVTFTLTDGDMLTAMNIQLVDYAGMGAETVAVEDANSLIAFSGEKGEFAYSGKNMIVDMTAPTAKFTIEGDVEYYYSNNGVIYVKLNTPTDTETKKESDKKDVTVTAKMTVTDTNLSVNQGQAHALLEKKSEDQGAWSAAAGAWTESYLIHTEGEALYSKEFTVSFDNTKVIELNLMVEDLAGNPMVAAVEVDKIHGTAPDKNPIKVEDGKVTGYVTLDRRAPEDDDAQAPEILLKPATPSGIKAANDRVLYNTVQRYTNGDTKANFAYDLMVRDGKSKDFDYRLNAGLESVTWSLNNAEFVSVYAEGEPENTSGTTGLADSTYEYSKKLLFTAGVGESNTCSITVVAVDKVGNTITYVEEFAVDTLAPRIKVKYDNNEVLNDKYFKKERMATITVEDINFDASATKIETEVTPSGWSHSENGLIHIAACEYGVDGDYTFHISSTDLGANHTADTAVDYEGNAAPQEFTIDMTNPVLTVTFDPSTPSGIDNANVEYYNKITTANVQIVEHNFRASDVVQEFNTAHKLSDFTSDGDEHHAHVSFNNGNKYQFNLDYKDLAGNPVEKYVSPTFSVDTNAPKIDIMTENMTNETMNMVPDDLELQIRVTDEEANLESYNVTVTYLNNLFERVTVSGPEFFSYNVQDGGNTIFINFANIVKEKAYDGIYTVQVTAKDYAGNVNELTPPLVFSLNRFGSTFTTDDPYTIDFLTAGPDGVVYHQTVEDKLIIHEINPNRVYSDSTHTQEGSVLTVVVNGSSKKLVKDVDYTLSVAQQGEDNPWYVYTYTIDPSVFMTDGKIVNGRYSILIYGEDEAGNKNTNESNAMSTVQKDENGEYTGKIEFVLDNMAPIITTTGIESGEVYNAEYQRMQIFLSDNTPSSIQVFLNDNEVVISDNTVTLPNDSAWLVWDTATGNYILNVPEQTQLFGDQSVRIVASDAAGNTAEADVTDFNVSTNLFVRLINSGWFLGGILLMLAAVVVVFLSKKKKTANVD